MGIMSWFKQFLIQLVTAIWDFFVISILTAYYFTETMILSFTPPFLRTQKSLKNKIVLITGGAGGVGQELAIRLARINAKVVIWDINEKAIEKVRERIHNEGHKIYTYVVDVADRKNVYKNAELVKSEVGHVDIIINNAGIVSGQTLLDIPDDMIEKTFQTNVMSHYWTIKSFLGHMIKRGKGHIVTVGSLTGMLGTYKCTDYSASKYALRGLHESLHTELQAHGHDNIHMTLVCPYFINTGMFSGCIPRNLSMLEPRDVAKRIILALRREEAFVTMPGFARFILPLKNFIPAKLSWAIMYRVIQGPQSMMGLKSYQDTVAASRAA